MWLEQNISALFLIWEKRIQGVKNMIGIILFVMATKLLSQTKYGTLIQFTLRYFLQRKKIIGIRIQNINANPVRFMMLLGALTLLPDNVLDFIKKKELMIFYKRCGDEHFNRKSSLNKRCVGEYRKDNNTIIVYDDGFYGNWYWQVMTILHEIGHFIDFSLGNNKTYKSSEDKKLHDIFLSEKQYYVRYPKGNYYSNNLREYLSQSFAEYFVDNEFKNKCPKTSFYIQL